MATVTGVLSKTGGVFTSLTTMVKLRDTVCVPSLTCTVTSASGAATGGVQLMTPVVALMVMPAGNTLRL